jgi:hypothetical protein
MFVLCVNLGLGHCLTNNRYRKPLRDQLRFKDYEVNMVGSLKNGDMADNVFSTPEIYRFTNRLLTDSRMFKRT